MSHSHDSESSGFESESPREDSLSDAGSSTELVTSSSPLREQNSTTKMKDALITFILFVTLLTYGIGGNGPVTVPGSTKVNDITPIAAAPPNLKTKTSPKPSPFFEVSSLIDDFYNGDIFEAFSEAEQHENSLIFYYAPWDADCLATRNVLDHVADVFTDSDLYFGAVNCWTPKGECRKQFGFDQSLNETKSKEKASNVNPRLPHFQFPILVFYPRDRKGIQYNGPITVEALIEFLLSVRSPFEHLRTTSDLANLQARHNGRAIVGYFPDLMSIERPTERLRLKTFVDASFNFLEPDPLRILTGGFGVVTSEQLAYKLHLGSTQTIRLFLWNGTSVAYPNKTITSATAFLNWSFRKFQVAPPLTLWAEALGRKSISLSNKLFAGTGFSLLVFIPRINRFIFNEALSVVQEASIYYNSCLEIENRTRDLIQAIRSLRRESFLKVDSLLESCKADEWFVKTFESRPLCQKHERETTKNASLFSTSFNERKPFLAVRRKHTTGQSLKDRSIHDLQLMYTRLECTLAFSSASILPLRSARYEFESFQSELNLEMKGLGCTDNRSLNFYTLDYHAQKGLAKNLGLDGQSIQTVIVNPAQETYYLMNDEFTLENLSKFISSFHRNLDGIPEAKLSDGFLRRSQKPMEDQSQEHLLLKNEVKIDALSRANFLSMSCSNPLLLLYTSPSCGFCASAARTFLSVKKLFDEKAPNVVSFAFMDTHINDLPWSFTAISSPTVIYVPSGNFSSQGFNSETRVFPLKKPIDVPNLLNFIVANIPTYLKDTLMNKFPSSTKGHRDEGSTSIQSNPALDELPALDIRPQSHSHGEL